MTSLSDLKLDNLQQNISLAKYTAARLGGDADWFYMAKNSLEELTDVVQTAWAEGIPVRILGGGANVLVSDKGFRGLVIINRVANIEFSDDKNEYNVSATSGTGLLRLARECLAQGVAGMEWAVGVPGTVGGAVVNNAGAHGDDMSESVVDVIVLEQSGIKHYSHAEMHYSYRESMLKARKDRHFVVLQARFTLPYDEPISIKSRMEEFNTYRKRTQPSGATLGSIFKNPDGDYAGRLIQESGLKGYRVGDVEISAKHANFIVNHGSATASDYYALIQTVQETVLAKQGVELELEIELVGEW